MNKPVWIWENRSPKPDEFADFYTELELDASDTSKPAVMKISVDSEFGLYVNGTLVSNGQYPDFPYYKVYEEVDISKYLHPGKNSIAFEVWYIGESSSTYFVGEAGLWFELTVGDRLALVSSPSVKSRISRTYESYRRRFLTTQLGFGYAYDARGEDGWRTAGGEDFTDSFANEEREAPAVKRPIKRLVTEAPVSASLIGKKGNTYLFDLGMETVGYYRVCFTGKSGQKLKIAYAEHLTDGAVRNKIGIRDFSFDYTAREGENDYFGYFRRLGARYVELRFDGEVFDVSFDMYPRSYVSKKRPISIPDERLRRIYEVGVRTLECCMHDHYEDCPWREQALYGFDSRNQMLFGYHAFEETEFQRATLRLFAEDRRDDGLLSICIPASYDLVIPSFGLHYVNAVREYLDYTGDKSLIMEVYPKLESLLSVFISRLEGDLEPTFPNSEHWNFYEWTEHLTGEPIWGVDIPRADLVLNSLLVIALDNLAYVLDAIGVENSYAEIASRIRLAARRELYDASAMDFSLYSDEAVFTELGSALSILSGIAEGEVAEKICETLCTDSTRVKASLSAKCFVYDALLKTDEERYLERVLLDIKTVWGKMLDAGADCFWETELGWHDFSDAGSLCHGWSALPVYYISKYWSEK